MAASRSRISLTHGGVGRGDFKPAHGVCCNPAAGQPSETEPMAKPLSPACERVIQAMPPDAQPVVRQMLESDPAARRRIELGDTLEAEKRQYWTRETALRKIQAVFPGSDPAQILDTLESAQLGWRVRLAV